MKLLVFPLALALTASPDVETEMLGIDPFEAAPACQEDRIHLANARKTVRMQNLGDLPSARMELAVAYHEDGCSVPVVVKQDVER